MTRVLVVDDHALVRQGLRLMLELAGFDVTEAGDGAAAVTAVDEQPPDVVLMDLRMPVLDGVEATRRIAARTRVIALTTFDADEHVVNALRAGAVGFLLKDVTSESLADAVRRAAAGEPVMAPSVLARLMDHFAARPPRPPAPPAGVADLSERELEVLTRIGAGLSNAEIAADLFISMATVKTHVRHILAKLDVRDRAQAIVVAHEAGLRG
ncbi:response regulator transcription factor [Dactylosporangium aurantiacum]|uniref:Response regulator transcription factor n=1 Tax=Dactylosporangium aurantiacum TaxID=35754 RepID=A0A9Q9IK23_9ACTN|nr:response regulator transcription factor [Dactylosporangium aurantiacum]MDG6107361.1 response regulator transcription factor [Dactylosporangium aurantiacum]UWZ54508.1 response regulator transcription factor [Dactylosporangium aurantiacum]